MGFFFLIVCAVGVLRPIKNALALEGLGATGFYKVYVVSAAVALFVPLYNSAADRVSQRWLVPGVALFFASHLLLFRLAFQQESAVYGLLFYGWYDLFTAVLVAQFFLAAQGYLAGRSAKEAYPIVIAGGAAGASLGSGITALFAGTVGTANLLLVAAALIGVCGVGLLFLPGDAPAGRSVPRGVRRKELRMGELRLIWRNGHARLIAASVFLAVLVKQLLDYQFNAITLEVFETRDAVSAFQGAFNAATQWLPILALLVLRPLIRRWGIQAAVLMLPAAMVATTLGLALSWSLWAVVAARATEGSLRYSAERTGREVLYIPLPDEIKLRAKTYIDVAIENGIGKIAAAGLIFVLLAVMAPAQLSYVSAFLSVLWLLVALAIRKEYVQALAGSIAGRYASLRGLSASLADATTRPALQAALAGSQVQAAFALDLLQQGDPGDIRPFSEDLHRLLDAPSADIRVRALVVLGKVPERVHVERVRRCLSDPSPQVRQAAVHVMCLAASGEREALLAELLASPEPAIRTAALACLTVEELSVDGARLVRRPYLEERGTGSGGGCDPDARFELALAAGSLRTGGEAEEILVPLLEDPDPAVASAALRSAGTLRLATTYPAMIDALGRRTTREAAREALVRQGAAVVPLLADRLLDPHALPTVRRNIPPLLARIPDNRTVAALLRSYAAPETDQSLDYRTLKALNRLRAHHPSLVFDPRLIDEAIEREIGTAARYSAAAGVLEGLPDHGRAMVLLHRALREGWRQRQESVFRLLGLLHPPREIHRCHLALNAMNPARRANALEWLEQTVSRRRFLQLSPVLREPVTQAPGAHDSLWRLWSDGDRWIAHCAIRACADAGLPMLAERLRDLQRETRDQDTVSLAEQLLQRLALPPDTPPPGDGPMDLIEKVFLLQQVDLLKDARGSDLALLASIAEEVEADTGSLLVRRGEASEALYVVIRGAVELEAPGAPPVRTTDGMSFGSWTLIEEAESLIDARVEHPSHLLRVTRDDFHDLLADHPELGVGLLQGLARRLRSLVSWRLEKIHEDHSVDEAEREEVQKLVRVIEGAYA